MQISDIRTVGGLDISFFNPPLTPAQQQSIITLAKEKAVRVSPNEKRGPDADVVVAPSADGSE